jgi:excisionase family DNA binding protein
MAPTITPAALKPKEAARYLSISERSIYNMIERGELKAIKVGRSTRLRVRDLDGFLLVGTSHELPR